MIDGPNLACQENCAAAKLTVTYADTRLLFRCEQVTTAVMQKPIHFREMTCRGIVPVTKDHFSFHQTFPGEIIDSGDLGGYVIVWGL